MVKKAHIQKAVIWCEKNRVPCNRFSEKINIFMPIVKDSNNSIAKNNTYKRISHGFESQEFASIIEDYSSQDFSGHGLIN
jgi:hypothetical protein